VIARSATIETYFFFSSRRRHTRFSRDWSSDVCSSDLEGRRAVAVTAVEHPAVLDAARWLGTAQGAEVIELAVDAEGVLDLDGLEIGRASCRERVWRAVGAGCWGERQTRNE